MSTVKMFAREGGSQQPTKNLCQHELPLGRRPKAAEVPLSVIAAQPSKLAALILCCQASGLESKEIYGPLGIDPGNWSRICKGDAHFPTALEHRLMDLCGNEIPLLWDALKRGYELKPLLSTLESQLAAERAARIEAEHRLQIIQQFVRETR